MEMYYYFILVIIISVVAIMFTLFKKDKPETVIVKKYDNLTKFDIDGDVAVFNSLVSVITREYTNKHIKISQGSFAEANTIKIPNSKELAEHIESVYQLFLTMAGEFLLDRMSLYYSEAGIKYMVSITSKAILMEGIEELKAYKNALISKTPSNKKQSSKLTSLPAEIIPLAIEYGFGSKEEIMDKFNDRVIEQVIKNTKPLLTKEDRDTKTFVDYVLKMKEKGGN